MFLPVHTQRSSDGPPWCMFKQATSARTRSLQIKCLTLGRIFRSQINFLEKELVTYASPKLPFSNSNASWYLHCTELGRKNWFSFATSHYRSSVTKKSTEFKAGWLHHTNSLNQPPRGIRLSSLGFTLRPLFTLQINLFCSNSFS